MQLLIASSIDLRDVQKHPHSVTDFTGTEDAANQRTKPAGDDSCHESIVELAECVTSDADAASACHLSIRGSTSW